MKYIPSTINKSPRKTIWVVDNFYSDPYAVREYALKQEFAEDLNYFKGSTFKRTILRSWNKRSI